MNSSYPNFFHFPLYFNLNQTFKYYQSSNVYGTNSTLSYNTMYSKNTRPFHFFENKFGRFISPGSNERIIERYGNLPNCSLYYISNSFESDIHIGRYVIDSDSNSDFCIFFSFPTKVTLNYSYEAHKYLNFEYNFTAYVNDKTYEIGSIKEAIFSNITDFVLQVSCPKSYIYDTPIMHFHLTNESDSIQNSTIPLKGTFNKTQLEMNDFTSFVTFNGKTTFDQSDKKPIQSFQKPNGFHLINSYSGSFVDVVYNFDYYSKIMGNYPSYHDISIINNFPFVKFGNNGYVTINTTYSSATLTHLLGYIDFTGPFFISNTNEKEYIFTNDYSKENFSILISYSENIDVNITIQSESKNTTFMIKSNDSMFSITGDKNLSIKNTPDILIVIIKDFSSYEENWSLKITRKDKILEKPTFPMNRIEHINRGSIFDPLSFIENINLFQNITRESIKPKANLFESYNSSYQYYLLNIFDIKQSFKFGLGKNDLNYAKIKFTKNDIPLFYFDTFGGNFSSKSNGGFMASTSGTLLTNPLNHPLFISNLNKEEYEFSDATYQQFLISYSQPVDLEITISPLNYQLFSDPECRYGTIIAVDHQTYRGNFPCTTIFRNVNALYITNSNLSGPMKIRSLSNISPNYTLEIEGFFDYKKLTSNWPGKYVPTSVKYWYIWAIILPILSFVLPFGIMFFIFCHCKRVKKETLNQALLQDSEMNQTEDNKHIAEEQTHEDQIKSKIKEEELINIKHESERFNIKTNQEFSPYEQSDEIYPYNTGLNTL